MAESSSQVNSTGMASHDSHMRTVLRFLANRRICKPHWADSKTIRYEHVTSSVPHPGLNNDADNIHSQDIHWTCCLNYFIQFPTCLYCLVQCCSTVFLSCFSTCCVLIKPERLFFYLLLIHLPKAFMCIFLITFYARRSPKFYTLEF